MNFYYEGQLAVIADQLERFDQERFWVVKWAFSAKDSCWIVAEQLERLTKEELLIIKWIFSTKNQLEIVAEQLGHFCHWILYDTGELILLIFIFREITIYYVISVKIILITLSVVNEFLYSLFSLRLNHF